MTVTIELTKTEALLLMQYSIARRYMTPDKAAAKLLREKLVLLKPEPEPQPKPGAQDAAKE